MLVSSFMSLFSVMVVLEHKSLLLVGLETVLDWLWFSENLLKSLEDVLKHCDIYYSGFRCDSFEGLCFVKLKEIQKSGDVRSAKRSLFPSSNPSGYYKSDISFHYEFISFHWGTRNELTMIQLRLNGFEYMIVIVSVLLRT